MDYEKLKATAIHDQDQEWAEARTWYTSHTEAEMIAYFLRVNEGTRESIEDMTDEEIAVMSRLAVLAFCEVVNKDVFDSE